jgi:hypothetical protein
LSRTTRALVTSNLNSKDNTCRWCPTTLLDTLSQWCILG